jgi:hypothetical protein
MQTEDSRLNCTEIMEAKVMFRQVAQLGSRVKHYAQRWTGCATATVIGFKDVGEGRPWIRVLVEPDKPDQYGNEWDWDRTEIAPDAQ